MPSNSEISRSLDEMVRNRGWYSPGHEYLAQHDPAFLALYNEFNGSLLHAGVAEGAGELALSLMHRQVLVAVLMAARGVETAKITRHIEKAFEFGASDQLVMEAMEVAMVVMGAPALHAGIEALIEASRGKKPQASE